MLTHTVRRVLRGFVRALRSRHGLVTIAKPRPNDAALVVTPLPPGWVHAGAPVTRTGWLFSSGDGALACGIWDCTAGTFDWHFEVDETVYVIDGSAEVQHGEQTHHLTAGSVAYFPMGAHTVWRVDAYVRKHFVHHDPSALLGSLVGG